MIFYYKNKNIAKTNLFFNLEAEIINSVTFIGICNDICVTEQLIYVKLLTKNKAWNIILKK